MEHGYLRLRIFDTYLVVGNIDLLRDGHLRMSNRAGQVVQNVGLYVGGTDQTLCQNVEEFR